MKIVLTESQYGKLQEVDLLRNSWGRTDIIYHLVSDLQKNLSKSKIISLSKKYFKEEVGLDISKFSDYDFDDYLIGRQSSLGTKYKKTDLILGLLYYISTETQKISKGNFALDFFKIKDDDSIFYYFLDPKFRTYIGFIRVKEDRPNSLFPKDTYSVSLSMVETTLIGHGYGKSMYLSLIYDIGCLISDTVLYKGSSNIWINVLWRYVPSAGYLDKFGDYVELPLKIKRDIGNTVKFFFASKSPKLIERLKRFSSR